LPIEIERRNFYRFRFEKGKEFFWYFTVDKQLHMNNVVFFDNLQLDCETLDKNHWEDLLDKLIMIVYQMVEMIVELEKMQWLIQILKQNKVLFVYKTK